MVAESGLRGQDETSRSAPGDPDLQGVEVRHLVTHKDGRGGLTEVYRDSWHDAFPLPRIAVAALRGNALRGMYVRRALGSWLVLLDGKLRVGLHDLRQESPSCRSSRTLTLGPDPAGLFIPPGIVHGFCSLRSAMLMYGQAGTSGPPADLERCHWSDPDLGIDWGVDHPDVLDSDDKAGPVALLAPWQGRS